MKWIGITGGIASGKSTVTKHFRDLGAVVIDADELAREVVGPQTFGLRALVQQFSDPILNSKGELDRVKLGDIIFRDRTARLLLERILHPLIQWRALQEKIHCEKQGLKFAFYDAALIYEKNLQHKFDAIIVVNSSREIQIKRLMERNKISQKDAEERLATQLPLEKKATLANYLIDNSGPEKKTKEQVEELFKIFSS